MQALIEFAFCLALFFLWIFLDRLRTKSSGLELKGWTELLLGVFFLFVGSILNVIENIPNLSKFLILGQTDFSTIFKTGLYILGIILVLISPLNWLSVLLERRMKDEDEERTEKFLRSLVNELKSKTKLPDIFNLAFPEITGFLKAQKGAAFLISGDELTLAASYGFSKESVEAMKSFKMEDDIISWCAKNKSSRIMNYFSQSEKRLTELICDEQAISLICSPLLSIRESVGVLAIFNNAEFTKEDLLTLSSLGEEIGEMIQHINNEREIKSKSEKVDSLLEQKESLATLCESVLVSKTDEILNRVVKIGKKMLHSNSCSVFEIDSENKKAIITSSSESGLLGRSMEISESSEINEAVEKKEIVFKTLETTDKGIKAVLVFPLFIQDQVLGVLLFEFMEYSPATTEVEIDLAKSLACLTSFVLFHQNLSRSYEKERELAPSIEFLDELKSGLGVISERTQLLLDNIQKGETDPHLLSEELKKTQQLISELSEFIGIEIPAYPQVEDKIPDVIEEEIKVEKIKILAIDDQQVIRDLLKDMSESLGYQIELAANGKEGLKVFEKDNFDLVITELDLPQVSGWEVSREVKRLKPEVLVILLIEWTVLPGKKMIEDYGVDFVLNKPFRLDQLSHIIQKAKGLKK
jgi:CheY-like chemotaxis protein/transcriptional regulator with GAF, ATPase, and Fis domain